MSAAPDFVPLDQQAIDALSKPCSSADAAAVLALAEEALAGLNAQAAASDQASLSPLASHAKAVQLRREAGEYRFEADRMDATVTALRSRVDELTLAEKRAAFAIAEAAAIAERDELAADIARDYPRIVYELTRLVQRIVASDARCASVYVREGAEAIGRKVPAEFADLLGSSFRAPMQRIQDMQLPMPHAHGFAWYYPTVTTSAYSMDGLKLKALVHPEPAE